MNQEQLSEMTRLGILEVKHNAIDGGMFGFVDLNEDEAEYKLSKDFKKRCDKIEESWTTGHFNRAVNMNKKIRYATTATERKRIVIHTQVLMSFFIEHSELQKMMKNNDLSLKKRLADYCTIIDALEEEENEEVFAKVIAR